VGQLSCVGIKIKLGKPNYSFIATLVTLLILNLATNPNPNILQPTSLSLVITHLLLRHHQRSIIPHGLQILLRRHDLPLPNHLAKKLEIIDVKSRCIRIDEFRLYVKGIGESVWCADWDGDEVVELGVYGRFIRDVVADCSLGWGGRLVRDIRDMDDGEFGYVDETVKAYW
jgi:hypothetical protein